MRRIDRWLMAHDRTMGRLAYLLVIVSVAYFAGSVALR